MARKPLLRRQVQERLRVAKRYLETDIAMIQSFVGDKYIPMGERGDNPNEYMRKRRPEELMEVQAKPWLRLASDFEILSTYFANEARNCRNMAEKIERDNFIGCDT